MKILVPVKRVVDYNVRVRVKADQSGVELDHIKMSMNPFDEIAVEEAIRLKEAGVACEVIVVSVGQIESQETLRNGLALGADRGILILADTALEPLNIAKLLRAIVVREQVDLVILGKQSIDGDHNQTGQMLAALLNWPQATFASKIECKENEWWVTREIDGGLETLSVTLPAVVTTDLRLNQPRYATLPNIMKAKKKPLDSISAVALGLDLHPHSERLKVEAPAERPTGIKVESVQELVDKLKNEAGVLS